MSTVIQAMRNLLRGLNPEQQASVTLPRRHAPILAGAARLKALAVIDAKPAR